MFVFPLIYYLVNKYEKKQERKAWEKDLKKDFEVVLTTVSTDLIAGASVENAWRNALNPLRNSYDEKRLEKQEKGEMERFLVESYRLMGMNVALEEIFLAFAQRVKQEDISNFAEVFSYAKRSGGNLVHIMEHTVRMLQDKREIENEIEVLVAGKKMEQRVMNLFPAVMLLYLRFTSADYLGKLYHNPPGVAIMIGCMIVYLFSVCLSKKILEIQV